jgi:hypothetical protein
MCTLIYVWTACDIGPNSIDTESGDWIFMGDSKLVNATSVFDKNGYWEHWYLEFENGVVLNTKEWETKPWWEGQTYAIYYNPSSRKSFLGMK